MLWSQRPLVIFGVGDRSLLSGPGVGVVGSRNVSDAGAEVAEAVARWAAAYGFSLVSGGARGVDAFAMNAAFRAGGSVIGVLADSLTKRVGSSGVLKALDDETACLISVQHPEAGFTPAAAMARNKLIYALSDVTLVVASDEASGGTWTGATEALRRSYGRVAVWRGRGEGPGNEALEAAGAHPIESVDELRSLRAEDEETSQLRLID